MSGQATQHKIKPLKDRVVVQRIEENVESTIILPDSAKKKPEVVEVLSVGPGGLDKEGNTIEMGVKAGDRVLVDQYAGQTVTLDDQEYIIVRADDISAIVE